MPRLRVKLASETGPKLCSTVHDSTRSAVVRMIRTQRVKANGVPAHVGFYPMCAECQAKEQKRKIPAGVSVKFVTL